MKKVRIAVLGASSHIAKGLIYNFLQGRGFSLCLYTRFPDKVRLFLAALGKTAKNSYIISKGYKNFTKLPYDIIINCVGVGTLSKLQGDFSKYFTVTEEYDNLAINYLRNSRPGALYLSLSSGAVYGREFLRPARKDTINKIWVNHICPEDYYGIVRVNSEAKHRAFKHLRIIDLRLFSYFSRFVDLSDGYFITEIIDCILKNRVFKTDSANIVRDYLHPKDLFSMVIKCMNAAKINGAFDVISSRPVGKREILDYFSSRYGLKYKVIPNLKHDSATGGKNAYYSRYLNAARIGYKPLFSSIDTIKQETEYILKPE